MLEWTRLINKKSGTIHLSIDGITPVCCNSVINSNMIYAEDNPKITCKKCLKHIPLLLRRYDYELEESKLRDDMWVPYNDDKHIRNIISAR